MDCRLVREWMFKERWSGAALAKELGVSSSTMNRYLNKKKEPGRLFLLALSAKMGVSFTRLQQEETLEQAG
jgi:transcriptional regulator with XRE-family HTH domain